MKVQFEITRLFYYILIMFNAFPDVIFTSGGTESNGLVFHSCMEHYHQLYPKSDQLPHIVTTNLEHDSVILTVQALKSKGRIGIQT